MLLEARGLRVGYGQGDVLRGVDLTVEEASIHALLGPNGAGKSTLMKTLAGLLRPSRGTVRFMGRDLAGHRASEVARCGLYLVPEGRALFPSLTVYENLRLASARPERLWGDLLERSLDIFPRLRERLQQMAGTLSGGEQQMLGLARAFIAQPLLLLLDEPSLGLAPKVVEEVFKIIDRFAAERIAIILVEQYVRRALSISDHATVLVQGKLVYAGSAGGVSHDQLSVHYLGHSSGV